MFSLKVLILLSLAVHFCKTQEILLQDNNEELSSCIRSIIKHLFHKGSEVTIVDSDYFDNEIIKAVHSMKYVSIISRTTNKKVIYNNGGYIITAKNLRVFEDTFNFLSIEEGWKPDVNFLIIFKELELSEINDLFKKILQYHVFKVLVINGASNPNVYTYNPFENYGCGIVYTRTISYGKCLKVNITKSFFHKSLTGLRKCAFKVAFSNAPPFVIIPNNDQKKGKLIGIEQYVLQTLSELEQFNVTYTYQYNPHEGSIVEDGMIATGPMRLIQKGDADIIMGGLILRPKRVEAFSFLCGHYTGYDGLIILVKKAGLLPNWKNIYIEFEAVVWILLGIAFIIFFVVFVVMYHTRDKLGLILIMWDILLLHGIILGKKLKYRYFMFIWIVFAYLINIHYQTKLSSITTQPIYEYQISKENDLTLYDIKPCISTLLNKHFKVTSGHELEVGNREECETMLQSITTVSQAHDKYTIISYPFYNRYKQNFIDKYGNPTIYAFEKPISKIIPAIYFYKGFPMLSQLQLQLFRIMESGLFDKHLRDLLNEDVKKQNFPKTRFRPLLIIPWIIFAFGVCLATGCFATEIIIYFIRQKIRNEVFPFVN